MNPSIRAISKSMRFTVMAAMIIATSGMLEGAGLPIFTAFGSIVRNLAAAQSEAKRLRDQAAASLRYVPRNASYQFRRDRAGVTSAPGQNISGRGAAGSCASA
jgi:hypothetical protein